MKPDAARRLRIVNLIQILGAGLVAILTIVIALAAHAHVYTGDVKTYAAERLFYIGDFVTTSDAQIYTLCEPEQLKRDEEITIMIWDHKQGCWK